MNNEIRLVKAEHFGEVAANIYAKGDEMFMTTAQIAECLGYSDTSGIDKIVERNKYLKSSDFSTTVKLSGVEGSRTVVRERRIFNEDGIYEITFLAHTAKAQAFRSWVRRILKSLRKGDLMLAGNEATAAPALTKAQIESYFKKFEESVDSMLNDKFNYLSAWIISDLGRRFTAIQTPGVLRVGDTQIPSGLRELIASRPNDSSWKKWVYQMIGYHIVVAGSKKTRREILNTLYRYITKNYTFVVEEERKQYRKRHLGYEGYLHTLELFADDAKWRDIFSACLIDYVCANGEGFDSAQQNPVVTTAQTALLNPAAEPQTSESVPEPELQQEPEPEPEPEPEKVLSKQQRKRLAVQEIIRPLVEKRNDTSKGGTVTFRAVYKAMPVEWNIRAGFYKKKHGLKRQPQRIDMVANDPGLLKIFKKTVADLLAQ